MYECTIIEFIYHSNNIIPATVCIVCTVHVCMHALGVLCCFALFVCVTLLASFFLSSYSSLI